MEGGSNSGRACNRRKEFEQDLNIMGIKTERQWPEIVGNGGGL
jgi:hypothetical protein